MLELLWYLLGTLAVLTLAAVLVWKKLVLNDEQRADAGYTAPNAQLKTLHGAEGVALTDLRPAGAARIENRRVDVVANSEYIAKNTPLRVVQVEGVRVVVEKQPNAANE